MRRLVLVLALAAASALYARPAAAQEALAGPYKFDFKIGPSIGLFDFQVTQFRLQPAFGINLLKGSPHHIYLDLPLGLGFGGGATTLTLIPGVQADIALPVPVPLYITPLFGMGIGFLFPRGLGDTQTALAIRLGAGVKYILQGMWNFYFEPFNIEIWPAGIKNATKGFYNLFFGAGVNF